MNLSGICFEAYKGNEPYIFISYAHIDSEVVYPIINDLHGMGYRIWYDEGIDPGNEWPDEIANALEKCAYFIVFISNNSVNSKNVTNEIYFALDDNKPFLAIHIVETKLSAGLRLRIGSTQAIIRYRMDKDSFDKKINTVFTGRNLRIESSSKISEDQNTAGELDENGAHNSNTINTSTLATIYDERGFIKNTAIHKNGTKYDDEGYNKYGYNIKGLKKDGYQKDLAWNNSKVPDINGDKKDSYSNKQYKFTMDSIIATGKLDGPRYKLSDFYKQQYSRMHYGEFIEYFTGLLHRGHAFIIKP